jgi:hypothetical protein
VAGAIFVSGLKIWESARASPQSIRAIELPLKYPKSPMTIRIHTNVAYMWNSFQIRRSIGVTYSRTACKYKSLLITKGLTSKVTYVGNSCQVRLQTFSRYCVLGANTSADLRQHVTHLHEVRSRTCVAYI